MPLMLAIVVLEPIRSPSSLLPVRRADEAFPKTDNIAEICAVHPSSGALYSRTRAPRPLHACAHRLPSVARRTGHVKGTGTSPSASRSQTTASFAACQWYDAATPTTPVHAARSREARAIDVARYARRPQRTTAAHLIWTRLCGRCKRRHAQTAADGRTTVDCRSPALLPDGRPCYLADASSKPYR